MKKKLASILLVVSMCAAMIAGCGKRRKKRKAKRGQRRFYHIDGSGLGNSDR